MSPDRRTLREWMAYLDSTEREITLTEFMAIMLFNQREYTRIMLEIVRELKNSTEYTEAMLGSLDQLAAVAARSSGLPYPETTAAREAMRRERDEARRHGEAAQPRGPVVRDQAALAANGEHAP